MRMFEAWFAPQRRFVAAFLLLLLLPAAGVVWLGARLIEQDRALELRQRRERRESAADRIVASLEQSLTATERRLSGAPDSALNANDDDAVLVVLDTSGIMGYPDDRLLYYPIVQALSVS